MMPRRSVRRGAQVGDWRCSILAAEYGPLVLVRGSILLIKPTPALPSEWFNIAFFRHDSARYDEELRQQRVLSDVHKNVNMGAGR